MIQYWSTFINFSLTCKNLGKSQFKVVLIEDQCFCDFA